MLKMIANTLKEELPEECTVIRMGGDEFMILCNGISEEKAIGFMDSIRIYYKALQCRYYQEKNSECNSIKRVFHDIGSGGAR